MQYLIMCIFGFMLIATDMVGYLKSTVIEKQITRTEKVVETRDMDNNLMASLSPACPKIRESGSSQAGNKCNKDVGFSIWHIIMCFCIGLLVYQFFDWLIWSLIHGFI